MIIRPSNGVENNDFTHCLINGEEGTITIVSSNGTFAEQSKGGGYTAFAKNYAVNLTVRNSGIVKYGVNSWRNSNKSPDFFNQLGVTSAFDFDLGLNPFTIDFWMYDTGSTFSTIGVRLMADANNKITIFNQSNRNIEVVSGGITKTFASSIVFTPENDWNHYAVVRNNIGNTYDTDTYLYFKNGELIDSMNWDAGDYTTAKNINFSGEAYTDGDNVYYDEFRITKGKALWTTDFTPPNRAS